jgi:HK97 gp10 family phage protein
MAYVPENKSVKLEGFAEFEQQLKEMAQGFRSDLIARRTLVPAAKTAMEVVLNAAKTRASVGDKPRDSKNPIHMRDTIRLDARIPSEKDKRSDYVNETDAAIAVVSVKKSAVSLANEFGTSKMGARPFLRPALQENVNNVLTELKSALAVGITDYAKKLERRRK